MTARSNFDAMGMRSKTQLIGIDGNFMGRASNGDVPYFL
jgi:hypothetical protein